MPLAVLVPLTIAVAVYALLAIGAALRFAQLRRSSSPQGPKGANVSVVVLPRRGSNPMHTAKGIRENDTTDIQVEVIVVHSSEFEQPSAQAFEATSLTRVVEVGTLDQPVPPAAVAAASGSVLLTTEAGATVPDGWIAAMAGACSSETPIVVGPIAYRHQDQFFPRLQALARVGHTAATAVLGSVGAVSLRRSIPNRAYHQSLFAGSDRLDEMCKTRASIMLAPEALVTVRSASSIWDYLQRAGQRLWRSLRTSSSLIRGTSLTCGLTNALLLGTGLVAIAWPAWRQPVLLSLLAKIGADAILTTPAARHFGERALLRSLVPTVLFLTLTTPLSLVVGALSTGVRTS